MSIDPGFNDPRPDWLRRFMTAFAQPVDRLGDVAPQLLSDGSGPVSAPATPTTNGAAPQASASGSSSRTAGQYYLPGVGPTYLNPQFADRVAGFITNAQNRGANISFRSAYRTEAGQDALHDDPTATTPAKNSLHSEGWAVDIHKPLLPNGKVDQSALAALVSDAHAAGLNWGGNFTNPDPGHFYYDPGGDRIAQRNAFTGAVAGLKNAIPDD